MFTKVWNDIKNGQIAPIYCIYGEESYLIDETINRLKSKLNEQEETEITYFDLEESPVDYVIDEADTFPFLSEKKLIIAKNASFLKATDRDKNKIDHDLTRLDLWLSNPPEFSVTVFVAPYEKLDERKKVTKKMKQQSVMIHAESLSVNDLEVWIRNEFNNYGKTIDDASLEKLVEMVGPNMLQLQTEIEKVSLYLGDETAVTVPIIEDLVAKTLEHDAFKMLNAYLAHNHKVAIEIYHDLLRQKEEPIMLVGLLASNIRTMNNVYYLQKKGYGGPQIAKQLKIHPYRVKLMLENRNRPTEERLLKALNQLAEIDLKLKSVSGNRERFLEMFLMKPL